MSSRTVVRPAAQWVARDRRWDLTRGPLLMGVINVTPDSFSDGGLHFRAEDAIAHGERLLAEGADLLDIGGESARPGARPIEAAEQIRRTVPVIEGLVRRGAAVSIDTTSAAAGRAALEAGAVVVNDVSAGRSDADLPRAAAEFGAGFVAMHMKGTPLTMQDDPTYQDLMAEVLGFLEERADALAQAGVAPEAIALDPGIGFGKTVEHNLTLLRHIDHLVALGHPVVVGASRKSFIGKVSPSPLSPLPPGEGGTGGLGVTRLPGSLAACLWAWQRGAQILRVHDVRETRQALTLWQAIAEERAAP
jgi:dihydropteroate synthase